MLSKLQQTVTEILKHDVGAIKDHEYFMILRKRSGLSQNELYLKSQINPQTVSGFECGKIDLPEEDVRKLIDSVMG